MKFFVGTFLCLLPSILWANDQLPQPDDFYIVMDQIRDGFNRMMILGVTETELGFYINAMTLVLSYWYIQINALEASVNDESIIEFLIFKVGFAILIFFILHPVNYFFFTSVIQDTANGLASLAQSLITGYDSFAEVPLILFKLFNKLTVGHEDTGILDWGFSILILLLLAFLFYKQFLMIIQTVGIYIAFSFIGFQIMFVFGLVILPLVFIKQLRFAVLGWGKAIMWMLIFTIMWKLVFSMAVFFMITAVLGKAFTTTLSTMTLKEFVHFRLNSVSEPIYIEFTSMYEVVMPVVFFTVSVWMLFKVMSLTQMLMTGTFNERAAVTS